MNYQRVLPRDAFNESKLLAQIALLTQLRKDNENYKKLFSFYLDEPHKGFIIKQNLDDGSIYVDNFILYTNNKRQILLEHPLNSKEKYSLHFNVSEYNDWNNFPDENGYVFNYKGQLNASFIHLLNSKEFYSEL